MKVKRFDFDLPQGSDYSMKLEFRNSVTGAAVDITGYTLAGKIKDKAGSATTIATFTSSIPDATNGDAFMILANATTSAITAATQTSHEKQPRYFVYDIEVTFPGSLKRRIVEGIVKFTPEVTV